MPPVRFEAFFAALRDEVERQLTGAPGCHDLDHTLRVLRNAEVLAALLPEADAEVVRAAALLHDVARPKELAAKGRCCHAREGAVSARSILLDLGCDGAFAEHVSECVRTHRYRDGETPQSLEAKIVYDADKLDSIGAVGIGRAFHFAGREQARLHNRADEALGAVEYSVEDTAFREYLVKLRHIEQAMLTEPGRVEAHKRSLFMDEFFRRMNQESGMDSPEIPER